MMKLLLPRIIIATNALAFSSLKEGPTIFDSETWQSFDPIAFEGVLRETIGMRQRRQVAAAEKLAGWHQKHRQLNSGDGRFAGSIGKGSWACRIFGFDYSEPGVSADLSLFDCFDPILHDPELSVKAPQCDLFASNPNANGFLAVEGGSNETGIDEPSFRYKAGCSWVFSGYKPLSIVGCINPVEARMGWHIPAYEVNNWYGVDGVHAISIKGYPGTKVYETPDFKIVENLDLGSCDGESLVFKSQPTGGQQTIANIFGDSYGSYYFFSDIFSGPQFYHLLNQHPRSGLNIVVDLNASSVPWAETNPPFVASDHPNVLYFDAFVTYNNFYWGRRMEQCYHATTCEECAEYSNLGCGWCVFPDDLPEDLSSLNWTAYYNYNSESRGSCGFTATKCLSVGGATFMKGLGNCPAVTSERKSPRGFFDNFY